jgi:hypothetical protein
MSDGLADGLWPGAEARSLLRHKHFWLKQKFSGPDLSLYLSLFFLFKSSIRSGHATFTNLTIRTVSIGSSNSWFLSGILMLNSGRR